MGGKRITAIENAPMHVVIVDVNNPTTSKIIDEKVLWEPDRFQRAQLSRRPITLHDGGGIPAKPKSLGPEFGVTSRHAISALEAPSHDPYKRRVIGHERTVQ